MGRTGVGSLAIDGAGGGDDDALDAVTGLLGEQIIEQRSTGEVDLLVLRDLVHRLARAGLGGEVDNDLVAREGGGPDALVAHVAEDEANGGLEISRKLGVAAVNLGAEVVQKGNGLASLYKSPSQTGSDETSAAGDEYIQKQTPREEKQWIQRQSEYSLGKGRGGITQLSCARNYTPFPI